MLINQEIKPISMPDNLIPYMSQCNADFEHKIRGWDISFGEIKNWLLSFFFKIEPPPPPERVAFDPDEYRLEIIREMSTRNRKAVLGQWEECGLDQTTAEYYMDYFALRDDEGKKYDLIIPADPATIFVWYRYEVHCWEEIGSVFGIYIYIWLYGFFFPSLMFEIPSRKDMSADEYKFLYENHKKFEYEMTMRRVVELILLYKNERNMNSLFFEPDIPTRPICCNEEWRKKLESVRQRPDGSAPESS
jgi:hypothetical protein